MKSAVARSLHRSLAAQDGFTLAEALVSAFLVLVVALATFTTLDSTGKASADAQERSVGASLLSSELQRVRSLSATKALANYSETRTQTAVVGTSTPRTFTITSDAVPVRDASGPVSCTTDTTSPEYLRTRSTVSWDGGRVSSSSLLTPSPGAVGYDVGTLSVHVTNRDGADVKDLTVTAAGRTLRTNELGCAVFSYVPAGAVAVSAFQSGWIAPNTSSPVTANVSVTARQVTKQELRYDEDGALTTTFQTASRLNGTTVTSNPPQAQSIVLTNVDSDFASPRELDVTATSPPAVATSLFPFKDSYAVWAGDCAQQNPGLYAPAAGQPKNAVVSFGFPDPRPIGSATAAVRMPTMAFRVQVGGVDQTTPLTVRVKPTAAGVAAGCNDVYVSTGAPTTVGGASYYAVPAPFGDFTVCAFTSTRKWADTADSNYDPAGDTTATAKALNSSTTGSGITTC